jgi:hypothetical protein
MRTRLGFVIGLGLLVALAGSARAGAKHSVPVTVGSAYASGSLGTARNSSDGNQYIGCQVYGTSSINAYCYAADSAGHYLSCSTTTTAMVALAESLTSDSYLYFSVNSSGGCTYLVVQNSSDLAPKNP